MMTYHIKTALQSGYEATIIKKAFGWISFIEWK